MMKAFPGAWLRSTRDPLGSAFGHLERAVMDIVWQGGEFSVHTVQGLLARQAA